MKRHIIIFLIILFFSGIYNTNNIYAKDSIKDFKINPEISLADSLFSSGIDYFKQGSYNLSLNYFIKSLKLYEKVGERMRIVKCYIEIGKIHARNNNFPKTREYYNNALIISKQYGNDDDIADAYLALGKLNGQTENYNKALYYFKLSHELYKKTGNKKKQIHTLHTISLVYNIWEKYYKALEYGFKSLDLANELGTKTDIAQELYNIASIYGDSSENQTAIEYFEKCFVLANELNLKKYKRDIYFGFSNAYINLKDYKNAVIYLQKYIKMNDTLFQETTTRQIAEMQEKYETGKKNQELKLKDERIRDQNKQAKQQRLIIILVIFGLVLTLIILVIIRKNLKHKQKSTLIQASQQEEINRQKIIDLLNKQDVSNFNSMMEGQEKERKRIAGELHDNMGSLLATVKLHFGSLEDSIENVEQFKTVNNLLDKACDDIRNISHSLDSGVLAKFDLISGLNEIKTTLENTKKLKVNISAHGIDSRLNSSIEIILYRIVQELVGNIIKHSNAKDISIELTRHEQNLNLIVEDNGKGFNLADNKGKGIGLKNIQSRIDNLNGNVSIDSRIGKGTIVIIDIPLKN
ncbi:MAG: sensor histidine kinase [Saprospiraceae bacterium]|nr:sensor histidine kinase [Saprospiraceae bacterium]